MIAVVGLCTLVLGVGPGFVGSSGAAGSGTLSIFAGTGTVGAPTPGPATSSDLAGPTDVAVDASGNVYIVDADNNMVLKVTAGGTLSVFAGTGAAGAPTPGPATSSKLSYPTGIAVDSSGNVYIADEANYLVEKVTPGGTLSIFAGTGVAGAPTPGPATSSKLGDPVSVAVDSSDNVYIADQGYVVEKVTPGGTLSIFAGTGGPGTPIPGPATSSPTLPFAVATDASDNVYIADGANNLVEKVTAGGTLSVFAGNGTFGAPIPGPATSSPMGPPYGLKADSSGNVYVADYENDIVVEITAGGTLSIFAGTGTAGPPTPGPATSSQVSGPWGVGVDGADNVYIADTGNHVVEKVSAGSTTVPDAPTAVVGTAGDRSVKVSWNPPGSDGGSPITGYTATAAPGGAICTTTGATRCVVRGLTNGTGYTFTVTATNAIGTSSPSSPSATVTPRAPTSTTTSTTPSTTTSTTSSPAASAPLAVEVTPRFTG